MTPTWVKEIWHFAVATVMGFGCVVCGAMLWKVGINAPGPLQAGLLFGVTFYGMGCLVHIKSGWQAGAEKGGDA